MLREFVVQLGEFRVVAIRFPGVSAAELERGQLEIEIEHGPRFGRRRLLAFLDVLDLDRKTVVVNHQRTPRSDRIRRLHRQNAFPRPALPKTNRHFTLKPHIVQQPPRQSPPRNSRHPLRRRPRHKRRPLRCTPNRRVRQLLIPFRGQTNGLALTQGFTPGYYLCPLQGRRRRHHG